ncbi:hypothetical protein KDN24_08665 [Bacillus sp. Bva_UNVM-123]|uniref:hypothetical protein n=1 Tax=Bacillus sp. Bva_UNVM-123 TaxID=2829798 RepID=UPI00391F838F
MLKKLLILIVMTLSAITALLTTFAFAAVDESVVTKTGESVLNEKSIIVVTGKDVPIDDNLPEEYRFPELLYLGAKTM